MRITTIFDLFSQGPGDPEPRVVGRTDRLATAEAWQRAAIAAEPTGRHWWRPREEVLQP
ncbi:hypothetical protein [Synechococcus sp. CCAP 1479/9]|uniref:hypothetical protein n=1 Tax=Synechococcus sp. CCAP 1479/9 TaxID=1221593 RepID=UPI001C21CB15|nr:hypothetical protein [Synechococcus sp. CCAP 1479/9]